MASLVCTIVSQNIYLQWPVIYTRKLGAAICPFLCGCARVVEANAPRTSNHLPVHGRSSPASLCDLLDRLLADLPALEIAHDLLLALVQDHPGPDGRVGPWETVHLRWQGDVGLLAVGELGERVAAPDEDVATSRSCEGGNGEVGRGGEKRVYTDRSLSTELFRDFGSDEQTSQGQRRSSPRSVEVAC